MKTISSRFFALFFCLTLISTACGGGTSSSNTSSGGTTVSTDSLTSINSVPDVNIANLDAATSSAVANVNSQASLIRYATAPTVKEFSPAGCEFRSCMEEFKRQVKEFEANNCIMEAMETHTNFAVGQGSYNYFSMAFDESAHDEDGSHTSSGDTAIGTRVKVGVIDDVLRLMICNNESGSYTQNMGLKYEVVDGQFSGTITNSFTSPQDSTESEAMQISVTLESDDPSAFDDGDSATINGQFNGFWGAGSIGLTVNKENSLITNTIDATFRSGDADSDWGTWTTQVYGKSDNQEGCAQFNDTGTHPAETISTVFQDSASQSEVTTALGVAASDKFCWKEADDPDSTSNTLADWVTAADSNGNCSFTHTGTECFWFETVSSTLNFYVVPTDDALYYDDVSTQTLDDFAAPTITFGTDETWDCEAPSGTSFTAIDIDETDQDLFTAMGTCFEDAFAAENDRDLDSCYEQANREQGSDDAGVDFEDGDPVDETTGSSSSSSSSDSN